MKSKNYILCMLMVLSAQTLTAQSTFTSFLSEIEQNNPYLNTLKKFQEANRLKNNTGLLPVGPDIEFAYLFGDPTITGNRVDFSVLQNFDFPSIYGLKRKLSALKNEHLAFQFAESRKLIWLAAVELICEIHFNKAKEQLLIDRLEHANRILSAYQGKFELGESTVIELNKATLSVLKLENELNLLRMDQNETMQSLAILNGNKPITIPEDRAENIGLNRPYGEWVKNTVLNAPEIRAIEQEVLMGRQSELLVKKQNLPGFHAGYISESIATEQFRGMAVGIHLPLWENRNSVSAAKAERLAKESELDYKTLEYEQQLNKISEKIKTLRAELVLYKEKLDKTNTIAHLDRSLNAGEITISDFFTELGLYYESEETILGMEQHITKYEMILSVNSMRY